jgi:hypothetical protein
VFYFREDIIFIYTSNLPFGDQITQFFYPRHAHLIFLKIKQPFGSAPKFTDEGGERF